MPMLPDYLKEPLVDPTNRATAGHQAAKTSATKMMPFVVESYDPYTHTIEGYFQHVGRIGRNVTIRVLTDYIGSVSGSGAASALEKGDVVEVEFQNGIATGLYNSGRAVGLPFLSRHKKPPTYAPWLQSGKGQVVVHPGKKGKLGNARHTDGQSNVSQTDVGRKNVENWGNVHQATSGTNQTRAEELTRQSATGFADAAKM